MKLSEVKVGQTVEIDKVGGVGELRQHFLDMGVIPKAKLEVVQYAPMGDPIEIRIHGYELTLRLDDAKKIDVHFTEKEERKEISRVKVVDHPGLGEDGIYHVKAGENPLPKDTKLTFALAGNQNCGKTTLFNQLTGSNQHVGNFPGVTVDKKSGSIIGNSNTEVTDLPGIYSLSPYTSEEIVSREFILNEQPKAIINILDATNIERNLYLTLQLMELDVPIVLALNMMDEVRGNGGTIMVNAMEEMLGVPVVPISASKNEGVDELIKHALHIAKYQEKPGRLDFCKEDNKSGAIHRCIHGIMHLIEDHAINSNIPVRFAATKIIEGDKMIIDKLNLSSNELEMIEHIVKQMEDERGLDRAACIAEMRFDFINDLCAKTIVKPKESKEHLRSRKIDKVLTGKFTAIPTFIAIMALIFYLTFDLIGGNLQQLLELGIESLSNSLSSILDGKVNVILSSFLIDGIINGVGSVLSFIPIIVLLFFFLSLLEDTGYMARIAFVMDKLLRKLGLSGRSIVPMLMGFGCTVPGVMASRTLPSERDRKLTILLTPFMSCSAKLPIYSFLALAFFSKCSWLVMIGIYILGILLAIIVALISKKLVFKGEAVPFVMELPNYRMPGIKNVLHLLWEKIKDFLERAFSLILIMSVIIWFLQSFSFRFNYVTNSEESMLAAIAGLIAPIFTPQGLNDYRVITSLISGLMAKETFVSSFTVLLGSSSITSIMTPVSALSLLVFCSLYTPCVAAIASIKRELGGRWAAFIVVFQCVFAYIVSLIIYLIGLLF